MNVHYMVTVTQTPIKMEIMLSEELSCDPCKLIAWKQRFERFRTASDLTSKAGEQQVIMLQYSMGEKSEDISSFKLGEEGGKNYEVVIKRFYDHFIVKKNKQYERSICYSVGLLGFYS